MSSRTPPMDPELVDEISERMLGIAMDVFGDAMTGMIVKGSAIKGDFIPDFSDFDLHIFARDAVMRGSLVPDISIAIPFQERFSMIDVARYRVSQIQVMIISDEHHPQGWIPPLPGTFRLIYGQMPESMPEVTEGLLRKQARYDLIGYGRWVDTLLTRIVDKPDPQLADSVLLAGTIMKAGLYEAAIVLGSDPLEAWHRSLRDTLETVEPAILPERQASRYYEQAWNWAEARQDGARLRAMITYALTTLERLATIPDLPPDESA